MLSEKEKNILDKAEDAILKRLCDCLDSAKPITADEFETLMDGVRVVDRICRMKYQHFSHSDKSAGTSSICPSNWSQS